MDTATHGPKDRLVALGFELPSLPPAVGSYVNAVEAGSLLFLAGHAPIRADGSVVVGRLGEDLDLAAGYDAARVAALGVLVTLEHALGTLDRVRRILRVYGVVNATAEFAEHSRVVNGASDLLVEVFGESGRHTRLAVGVASLPFNIALEIEVTATIEAQVRGRSA